MGVGLMARLFASNFISRVLPAAPARGSAKPPNILILCDSVATSRGQTNGSTTDGAYFQQTKSDLATCIGHDRYVIYPLQLEDVERSPWQENCQLLIAPACLDLADSPPNLVQSLVRYVEEGGRCLAMNEKFVHGLFGCTKSATSTSATRELCHVTPCVPWNDKLESFVAPLLFSDPTSTEKQIKLDCKPLAHFQGTTSACVQLVTDTHRQVQCIASSVNLLAPSFESLTVSMVTELKQSAQARHSFLGAVLQQLGVEYVPSSIPSLSYTYLFTRTDEQQSDFLNQESSLATPAGLCYRGDTTITITTSTEDTPPPPSPSHLSIITSPPAEQMEFNLSQYYETLHTTRLGQVVLYTPVIASTQSVFTGNIKFATTVSTSGVICIAGQQTQGKGRGGNQWISPKGCMMFSFPLNIPSSSRLSRYSSILQHITSLAVVSAIRTLPGYETLEVEIKWPNDIYYKRKVKLGGILVTAFTMGTNTTAIVGCGVNVTNHYPTMSLNDCIALHQQEQVRRGSEQLVTMKPLSVEQLLALTLNKMELYLRLYEKWGLNGVQDLYYQYWMHGGSTVQLTADSSGANNTVTITGIDEFGYLRVLNEEGRPLTVCPDGNTFDIMKGLIAMKK